MTRFDISNYQGTVTRNIKFAGVGLHTGKLVELDVLPAAPNTGIKFSRTDVPNPEPILAHPDNITSTTLCTTIGNGNYSVSTIEHLMAAFAGLGIDNALVQVNACELPILDGSAAPFVDKLNEVGIQIQSTKRKVIIPKRVIEVECGDQYMRLEPLKTPQAEQVKNPHLDISCSIDFPFSKVIGQQTIKVDFSRRNFMDLCEARTFCHVDDVSMMRKKGLAQGGSLDNAVVVNHERVMNNDGLRYDDEFVRHKLLDCIGDLALLGGRLTGKLTLHKAGHGLHAQFTKKILEEDLCTTVPCNFEDNRINAVEGMGLAAMAKKDS